MDALVLAGHPVVPVRDDLTAPRVALADQLRGLLEGFWPDGAVIFAAIDSPIALAFLGRYPTSDSAARLDKKRLASFLAQPRLLRACSPAELLSRLRAASKGLAGDTEADAKGELVRAQASGKSRAVVFR